MPGTSLEDGRRHSASSEYHLQETGKSVDSHDPYHSHPAPSALESGRVSRSSWAFDPNIDNDAELMEDDSPYPEVRSAVANCDDETMPVSTIRAWTLGLLSAIILPGLNQFFTFRYPYVLVSGLVAQLVVFPLGRLWARIVPRRTLFGMHLNPGPFTIKEHVLVTVMAGVGWQPAYATEIVAVQRVYYGQEFNFIYSWMLVMSTQIIGFSIGGITRRFLVVPPSMIWPNTLVLCALFNTLHSQSYIGIGRHDGISRERFFTYVLIAATVWYIVPGYLFTALSLFNWVCWIAPNDLKVNQIFGDHSGLGFSVLTFDWSQIAFIGSPLVTPWWAEVNVVIGFVFFYWFITPILYYTNVWSGSYMPIFSRSTYDNTGEIYNLTRILFSNTTVNIDAYKSYSPLFLPTAFAVSYCLSFMSISATITHALLHFWTPIKLHFRRSLREHPDIHAKLMSKYRQVPHWWYAITFVTTFAFACICIEVWPVGMTIWALVLALIISLIYVIPIGMIQAVTNRQIGLNVLTELIVGYILPGRPVAMMMFKTWGYITMAQAMQFTADLKLGHYMKVPPRPLFWCQMVGTLVAATVQLGVQAWLFSNIPDFCEPDQKDGFICANTQVFGSASIVWGVVGPALQYSKGQLYYAMSFLFIVGAVCPLILWAFIRKYPTSIIAYLNFPLIFAGTNLMPQGGSINYVPWAIVGFVFQYLIRRRHFPLWAKYNYVLSAALDAGTAFGIILVYFCLQYPRNGTIGENTVAKWWGNTVYKNTADWLSIPLRAVPPGETFGPTHW